jgi:hypothetical protein
MSAVANFLMIQYKLGNITEAKIKTLVGKRLTQEEANGIIEGDQ